MKYSTMKKTILSCVALCALSSFADLYLAGDSTMCNYGARQYPQQGWGQALYRYMKDPDQLHNWAIGGRSARSYRDEGRWQKIVDALKPGDFVIAAFGHNDANKRKKERYSTPEDYTEIMRGFANDVKAKGATMVFATSIPHSGGVSVDKQGRTHVRGSAAGIGPYVAATRTLGKEMSIEVLDLNDYAVTGFESMGAEKVYKLYMRIAPGEYAAHPNGKKDGCHTRDTGANFFARGVVMMARTRRLPLMTLFKDPDEVVFTPIGFDGKEGTPAPARDDFSKEEIAYAFDEAQAYGTTKYGEKARLYTLKGKGGLEMQVTDVGGKVVRLLVPDKKGKKVDVTFGFDDISGWEKADPYSGAIIGRVGNRIARGTFTLDGKTYTLAQNDADHHAALHGGMRGWDAHLWQAEPFSKGGDVGIVFTRTSPDGEEGFPGTVKAKVTYTITPANVWRIQYEATTDKPTPLNMTQHVYLNLNGKGTILDHELMIAAETYLPVDADLAPVGKPASVAGTPFDFRTFHKIGERINAKNDILQYGPGYDHNWCLDGTGLRKVAEVRTKKRAVEVWTDQIGLQFYSCNAFQNSWKMRDNRPMLRRGWLALETQHYPNTPNRSDFPSVILKPGETYSSVTEYHFK